MYKKNVDGGNGNLHLMMLDIVLYSILGFLVFVIILLTIMQVRDFFGIGRPGRVSHKTPDNHRKHQ